MHNGGCASILTTPSLSSMFAGFRTTKVGAAAGMEKNDMKVPVLAMGPVNMAVGLLSLLSYTDSSTN
jgi:hypothetical protein